MTEACDEAIEGVDMEIAAATEVDSDGMEADDCSPTVGVVAEEIVDDLDLSTTAYDSSPGVEGVVVEENVDDLHLSTTAYDSSPGVEGVVVEENVDDLHLSTTAYDSSPGVEGVVAEENVDDLHLSSTAYSANNLEGIEVDVAEDAEPPEPKESIILASDASKPLKSILKKRKTESIPGDQDVEEDTKPADKIPKGGSITQALKLLTGYTNKSDDEGDDTEPKPSAFVLEMERQKAMSANDPGAMNLPAGYGITESSIKNHYFNPFDIHKNKISDTNEQQEVAVTETDGVAKPADSKQEDGKRKETNYEIEAVLLINNLPFKITKNEIMAIMGICPKGGKDGIQIITDSCALPTGYAYVTVERYYDMTDLFKLSGFDYQGRRLRVTKSTRESLLEDWEITKIALSELEKSRVICVKHLPFVLTRSALVKALHEVKFNEEDIYWSPLRKNQTNSGRAFVVLRSCEDAKKLHKRSFPTNGRHIGVTQVHPGDMMKFLKQCRMFLRPGTRVLDDLPPDAGDISDLSLGAEKPPSPAKIAVELAQPQKKSKKAEKRLKRLESEQKNWKMSPGNFVPTVYVRLFNAPERTTTNDIKLFFEPLKAAKISQNFGFNIWDVEFFSPGDGMQAMSKHALMMRKNVIRLEMLRGPPQPPQPHQFAGPASSPFIPPNLPMMMPHPGMIRPPGMGAPPRGMMPPPRMDSGPPGMMQHPGMNPGHPGFPGMVGSGMPPPIPGLAPMFPPRMRHPMPPMGHPMNVQRLAMPHPESERYSSFDPHANPRTMPLPFNSSGHRESRYESRRGPKAPSPEHPPPPKKELIPVPPLPDDFTKYEIPPFDGETPVGQAIITPMQGYFCQLCNKFYSTKTGAKDAHCKTKGHYDKLKQVLEEKKRLRKLAEAEHAATG